MVWFRSWLEAPLKIPRFLRAYQDTIEKRIGYGAQHSRTDQLLPKLSRHDLKHDRRPCYALLREAGPESQPDRSSIKLHES